MTLSTTDWAGMTVDQLHWHWQAQARPRLDGLTDDEYFWEPVPGCLTLRRVGESVTRDVAPHDAEPPPVTTIALRLAHITVDCLAMRTDYHFGERSLVLDAVRWPSGAGEALAALDDAYDAWHRAVSALDDAGLARHSQGPPDTLDAEFPFAAVILHINREVIHHAAEVALLRDLYRAAAGSAVTVAGR